MTMDGIRSIDLRFLAQLRILGAGRWALMREVIWHSALPFVLAH